MRQKVIYIISGGVLCALSIFGYQIFWVDTSIDTSSLQQTGGEEHSIGNTGDSISDSIATGDPLPIGEVRVSDWREFPTREMNVSTVVSDLDAPWGFVFLPDDRILITERFGNLQLVDKQGNKTPVSGVPQVFAGGQGGLLDVTVHPNFVENSKIYLSYSHGTEEANRLRIARAVLDDTTLESVEIIFEVAQSKNGSSHFGSRFQWLPDRTLLFSVGDGGNPPIKYNGELIREQAQYLSSHLGKIIRINDDGTIPDNNPFVGRPDVRQEIYSYGHRNIQGITYDTQRGRIIASEHGSKGGDELNIIMPGKNYGRPNVSYSTEYDVAGTPISETQSDPDFVDPLGVWTPTIAPSEVVFYDDDRYDDWQGNLFLAAMLLRADNTLGAYASSPAGSLLRLVLDEQGYITQQERLLLGEVRVRSVEQGPDGHLYVLTDATGRQTRAGDPQGALIKIE